MATNQQEQLSVPSIASDLVLWGLLAGVLALLGCIIWLLPGHHPPQTLELTFQDANELLPGSNVRMMGVDVGYVDRIHLQDDQVNVQVKTASKGIEIPPGSQATIEFTGLVGSKSIEVLPPPYGPLPGLEGTTKLLAEEPIRLKSVIEYNLEIAQALQKGADAFSGFFGPHESVGVLQTNIRRGHQAIQSINTDLAQTAYKLSDVQVTLAQPLHGAVLTAQRMAKASEKAAVFMERYGTAEAIQPVAHRWQGVFNGLTERFNGFSGSQGHYERVTEKMTNGQTVIQKQGARFSRWDLPARVARVEATLERFDTGTRQAEGFFARNWHWALQYARGKIQAFNQKLGALNRRWQPQVKGRAPLPLTPGLERDPSVQIRP